MNDSISKPVVPDVIYKTLLKLTGSEDRERPLCANAPGCSGVDKRPSAAINMKLLSNNEGAVHGYRHQDRRARTSSERAESGLSS